MASKKTAQDILEDLTLHWMRDDPPEDADEIYSHISSVQNVARLAEQWTHSGEDREPEWEAVIAELEEIISQAAQGIATIKNTQDLSR